MAQPLIEFGLRVLQCSMGLFAGNAIVHYSKALQGAEIFGFMKGDVYGNFGIMG